MKRTLLTLAFFALLLPAARDATAAEVSIDFFYNNLSGGQWIEVADYGYGWQPDVATSDPNWRPYADGYWAYTDLGWTWISYEDFGWATYHYGRWARLADYGWVWLPGSDLDWGPAWVSWRVGGGYVGWAPLPPRGPGIVYRGEALVGPTVDLEFDIGPAYYNFIDVRYIGEPVLRDRIFAPTQNVTYINQTVNVTNITYKNSTVYNYGPDYNILSGQSSRPIQRLAIERQSVDPTAAVKSGSITKVQGDKLVIAAPPKIQKPSKAAAPPAVKTRVAQAKVEKGWTGVADAEQLKQKIRTENPKQIPPPPRATAAGAAAAQASPAAAASPAATGAAATTVGSPVERAKVRGKSTQRGQAAATASPAVSSPSPAAAGKRGRGLPGEQLSASPAAGAAATAAPAASGPPQETRGKHRGEFERTTPAGSEGRPGALPRQVPPRRPQGAPPSATPFTAGGENVEERSPVQRAPEHAAASPEMRRTPGERGPGLERGEGGPAAQREPAAERTERGPAAQRTPSAERGERGPARAPGGTEAGKKKPGASPSPSP